MWAGSEEGERKQGRPRAEPRIGARIVSVSSLDHPRNYFSLDLPSPGRTLGGRGTRNLGLLGIGPRTADLASLEAVQHKFRRSYRATPDLSRPDPPERSKRAPPRDGGHPNTPSGHYTCVLLKFQGQCHRSQSTGICKASTRNDRPM